MQNIKNAFLTILYSLMFIAGYYLFLNFYFGYMGYTLNDGVNMYSFLESMAVAVIPIFFYRGSQLISSFISIFIFLMLYIPIIFTLILNEDAETIGVSIVYIQITFMIGMIILFFADRISLKEKKIKCNYDVLSIVLYITIISILYVLFNYRANLSFSGYDDVYEHRFANVSLGKDIFTSYLTSWLSNFMIPICLAYGVVSKNKMYFIVGVFGCLSIYMSTAGKSVMTFPFIIYGIYVLLTKNYKAYTILALTLVLIMGVSLLFDFNNASSLLWMRTIGIGGLLTIKYYCFFSSHPLTYYTHINIINFITNANPYGTESIGQVVGSYYWSQETNANANFWAADGLAAVGLFGVILSSVFAGLIFTVYNKITKWCNHKFVFMCFIPYLFQLLNTSLFSSLLTGGGFLLMLFFLTVDRKNIYLRQI